MTELSSSNRPNPFNSSTEIKFNLPAAGDAKIKIYDITGSLVKELASGPLEAGRHLILWDGTNMAGAKVGSGIYLYTISAVGEQVANKMVFLK